MSQPSRKTFHCRRCEERLSSSVSLKQHLALHDVNDGNLVCSLCAVKFETRSDIIDHLKTHTSIGAVRDVQDKKFPCEVCGKRFFTRKDVKRHQVVHTGSRNFACHICLHKFGRKDHLVRHLKKSHVSASAVSVSTSAAPGGQSSQTPTIDEAVAADVTVSVSSFSGYDLLTSTRFPTDRQRDSQFQLDIPEPANLPSFESPEVLPDLGAMLHSEGYTASSAGSTAGVPYYVPQEAASSTAPTVCLHHHHNHSSRYCHRWPVTPFWSSTAPHWFRKSDSRLPPRDNGSQALVMSPNRPSLVPTTIAPANMLEDFEVNF